MAYVRRHWLSSALYLFIIVAGLVIALTPTIFSGASLKEAHGQTEPQAAADPPKSVDPYLWTRVQKMRQELSLTTADLAAMGCDVASATQVLTSLKTWCLTNQAALDQQHRQELQAKAAIRKVLKAAGDVSAMQSLASLQASLAEAQSSRRALKDTLVTQLESLLSTEQAQVWQAIRDNRGLPPTYRYAPSVTDTQRAMISENEPNALTWDQTQAFETAKANISGHTKDVFAAEAAVLPIPPQYTNTGDVDSASAE